MDGKRKAIAWCEDHDRVVKTGSLEACLKEVEAYLRLHPETTVSVGFVRK